MLSHTHALPTALASHTVCVLSIPDTFSWPIVCWEQILVPKHYFTLLIFLTSVFYFFAISLSLKLLKLFIPKALNLIHLTGHL